MSCGLPARSTSKAIPTANVFDWAWANAYAEHGLPYYPKAVVAVPFTPVPGTRVMARDCEARAALVQALRDWCTQAGVSRRCTCCLRTIQTWMPAKQPD